MPGGTPHCAGTSGRDRCPQIRCPRTRSSRSIVCIPKGPWSQGINASVALIGFDPIREVADARSG